MQKSNTDIAIMTKIPPTTPPIMGPRGIFFFLEFDLIFGGFVYSLDPDPAIPVASSVYV